MSKANDKAAAQNNDAATTTLYKVGFTYLGPNCQLRSGALIIEAENIQKAKDAAEEQLAATNYRHVRITNAKGY